MPSSITLPDIKPLASLLGPSSNSISADLSTLSLSSSSSVSSGTYPSSKPNSNPAPISFINNLVPGSTGKEMNQSPWGEAAGVGNGTSSNEFNANFADFEDAFNNVNHTTPEPSSETFNGFNGSHSHNNINNVFPTSFPLTPKMVNGGFQPFQASSSNNMQQPLQPHHGNGFQQHPSAPVVLTNGGTHSSTSPALNS
jgi:hypothetical protein